MISITIFHVFREVEERLTMLSRDMENGGKKDPNQTLKIKISVCEIKINTR